MKKQLLLLCLFGCLFFTEGKAQATLGVGRSGIGGVPDSVRFGSVMQLNLYVINKGNQSYTGRIGVNVRTDKVLRPRVDSVDVNNWRPGDSVQVNFSFEASRTAFNQGMNIIVIWPTGTGIRTVDSAFTSVEVLEPSGIYENKNIAARVSVFPNPASNFLNIEMENPEDKIRFLDVFDAKGNKINVNLNNVNNLPAVDISHLPAGLYFVNITLWDKRIGNYKFIKN